MLPAPPACASPVQRTGGGGGGEPGGARDAVGARYTAKKQSLMGCSTGLRGGGGVAVLPAP